MELAMKKIDRREFIKIGLTGLSAIAIGTKLELPGIFTHREAYAATVPVNLTMTDAFVEFNDLNQVYMWTFADSGGPKFPGPTIFVNEGDTINLNITNTLDEDHGFAITGTRISGGVIAPGATANLSFQAPPAGTYLYYDPLNPPVNRVLGLHGVLVVLPGGGGVRNPYSNATNEVDNLFDDLGNTPHFPGDQWRPERTWIWTLHQTDPRFNAIAGSGAVVNRIDMVRNFLPRYFTISGKGGFFSAHDPNISPSGMVGQPALIRIVNAGLTTHSTHIHANHAYVTSVNGTVSDNVYHVDTYSIRPMDRVDWMVPFVRPPDIPDVSEIRNPGSNPNRLIRLDAPEELALVLGGVPQSPLEYPMHCHTEMSQSMAGGNYPMGLVVHVNFLGDVDGVPFPNVI